MVLNQNISVKLIEYSVNMTFLKIHCVLTHVNTFRTKEHAKFPLGMAVGSRRTRLIHTKISNHKIAGNTVCFFYFYMFLCIREW